MSLDELSCVYSTLILQDDNVAVTADKIKTLLKAANITVESYWPTLFVKALEDINLTQLVANVGSGVGTAAPSGTSGGTVAATEAQAVKEEPKEEKKEESEESDDDMGFGLFD